MSTENLSALKNETKSDTFSESGYFLGIVRRVIAAHDNARITLPKKGGAASYVVILSDRHAYYSNVSDPEYFSAPADHFEVTVFDGEIPAVYLSGHARDIKDLLWLAGFHASEGRLPEGCSKLDVVQFLQWPNLTRLPTTQNAARICALLTRQPITIMLVHRILGIHKEEVYLMLSAAYSAGLVRQMSSNLVPVSHKAGVVEAQPEPVQERSLFRSLFAKISGL